MRLSKRTFLRAFFAVEVVIFIFMYLFGAQGIMVLRRLQRENKNLEREIEQLDKNVGALETKLSAWRSDPFYKEKIARERLHMARKNDVVFLIE